MTDEVVGDRANGIGGTVEEVDPAITIKVDGKVKRANVCTKCIKAGKIVRA